MYLLSYIITVYLSLSTKKVRVIISQRNKKFVHEPILPLFQNNQWVYLILFIPRWLIMDVLLKVFFGASIEILSGISKWYIIAIICYL